MKNPQPTPEVYPFSLVLGPHFRPCCDGGYTRKGDEEVRNKLHGLVEYSNSQALGRLINILATGQSRFTDIPGLEPHVGHGVTFKDPFKLFEECEHVPGFGEGTTSNMRRLILSSATVASIEETSHESQ